MFDLTSREQKNPQTKFKRRLIRSNLKHFGGNDLRVITINNNNHNNDNARKMDATGGRKHLAKTKKAETPKRFF